MRLNPNFLIMYNEESTTIAKGRDGYKAETFFTNGENAINVSTFKSSRGIITHYQFGKLIGHSFSFMLFQDKSGRLGISDVRCTEKSIRDHHDKCLAQFKNEFQSTLNPQSC
jgi:hypothetical protein